MLQTGGGVAGEPYDLYRQLREIAPVVRAEDGTVLVLGYDENAALVRSAGPQHPAEDTFAQISVPDWEKHVALRMQFKSLVRSNPPYHTKLRRLVISAFTARRVQSMRSAIERIADDLLDRMGGTADFIDAMAGRRGS